MEFTAFTCRLGEGQGRLGPGRFVLGDGEPGRVYELEVGDFVELSQQADLTGASLVRVGGALHVPSSLPAGLAWEASMTIDGVKVASLRGRRGSGRRVADLVANVSKLNGPHVVGVRLELVPG